MEKVEENTEKSPKNPEKLQNSQMALLFTSITTEVQKFPPEIAMGAVSGSLSLLLEYFHKKDPKMGEIQYLELLTFLEHVMKQIRERNGTS